MSHRKPRFWLNLQEFADGSVAARTPGDLHPSLERIVSQLGFSWFALVDTADLGSAPTETAAVTNYPIAWQNEIIGDRLYADDPAHAASSLVGGGVPWDEIGKRVVLTPHQTATLKRAQKHGLRTGFTMQLRSPGEPSYVFSVARPEAQALPQRHVLSVHLIAAIVHEHADRLFHARRPRPAKVHLSPRQIDCLTLVAQGKTDWEIATILGVTRDTVHEYVESARHRYGVQKRVQVVLRAIQDGYLSYASIGY